MWGHAPDPDQTTEVVNKRPCHPLHLAAIPATQGAVGLGPGLVGFRQGRDRVAQRFSGRRVQDAKRLGFS